DVSGLFVDCCGDRPQGCDRGVALFEIALDFEIKVFPVITCQSDSCPTQAETVLDRGQTKTTLECGNIAILELRLNISAECQLKLWTAGNDVNRGFLFRQDVLFDVCFSVRIDFRLCFPLRSKLRGE